jgi:hypothetical protein
MIVQQELFMPQTSQMPQTLHLQPMEHPQQTPYPQQMQHPQQTLYTPPPTYMPTMPGFQQPHQSQQVIVVQQAPNVTQPIPNFFRE